MINFFYDACIGVIIFNVLFLYDVGPEVYGADKRKLKIIMLCINIREKILPGRIVLGRDGLGLPFGINMFDQIFKGTVEYFVVLKIMGIQIASERIV